MIIANQKGFNIENNENYAISAAITEKGLSSPIIVKTTKTSNNIYKIGTSPKPDFIFCLGTKNGGKKSQGCTRFSQKSCD